MLNSIIAYFKNKYSKLLESKALKSIENKYGVSPVITKKLIKIVNNTQIELLDSNIYINQSDNSLVVQLKLVDVLLSVYLTDTEENLFGDRVYIDNPLLFCKSIKKTSFPEVQDLFGVGYDLSVLDLPDPVAELLADVLIAWNVDFSSFYCYSNDTHAIMMWELYDKEYLFTECNLFDTSDLVMYVESLNTPHVLNYIEKNYAD